MDENRQPKQSRFIRVALWLLVSLWLTSIAAGLIAQAWRGTLPIDYRTYQSAADALGGGESPYLTPEAAQGVWRDIHALTEDFLAGQLEESPSDLFGPYLYPPTLASLVASLKVSASARATLFLTLLLLSVLGFGWLWLHQARLSAWWLLLVALSWDVLASFAGGNVELSLLFLTLLAATWLWRGQGVLAALPVALVILVKPFYALFFISFGLLLWTHARERRALLVTAVGTLALTGLEVLRWGELRGEVFAYFADANAYSWLALPLQEQTPMSIWNRTPLQGFVNAGIETVGAQVASLVLWLSLTLVTLWLLRNKEVHFPLAFALALTLLYLGRPVGWGLIYLEVVVVGALWPRLKGWERCTFLAGALVLMLTHWAALALTLRGVWVRLFTLQSAAFPWETWGVLPLLWLLLVLAGRRTRRAAG